MYPCSCIVHRLCDIRKDENVPQPLCTEQATPPDAAVGRSGAVAAGALPSRRPAGAGADARASDGCARAYSVDQRTATVRGRCAARCGRRRKCAVGQLACCMDKHMGTWAAVAVEGGAEEVPACREPGAVTDPARAGAQTAAGRPSGGRLEGSTTHFLWSLK
jgi:hypothetical protein